MIAHLFRKRSVYLPTWKLSLVLALLLAGVFVVTARSLYPFLAVSGPLKQPDVIVVDGWVSDRTMEAAMAVAREQSCDLILSTGVDLPVGNFLSQYKSYAQVGEATLEALGIPADQVHPTPAGANQRNRTFASAAAVYQWLEKENRLGGRINVITEGPHSRRSLAVYRKVFRDSGSELGIQSEAPVQFEPGAWWKTSSGMKSVMVESIALADEWLRDGGRSTNDPHSVQTGVVAP